MVSMMMVVANGGTRRSLVTASAIAVTIAAAVYAVLLTLAFRVEVPVYESRGWPLDIRTGHLFESGIEWPLVLAESFAIAIAVGLAGLAVGAGYRRFGGARGTLALAFTATPMLLATAALELRASSGLGARLGVVGLSVPLTFAVLALTSVVSLMTAYRLLDGAPARAVGAI